MLVDGAGFEPALVLLLPTCVPRSVFRLFKAPSLVAFQSLKETTLRAGCSLQIGADTPCVYQVCSSFRQGQSC